MGLAWSDVVQSYRRTFFGPFWITLNLIIFATAITLVMGSIFKVSTEDYASYVVCGMIVWLWVSAMLTDVGNTFLVYSQFLRSTPIDKAFFIWAAVGKQTIVLAHQMIVYLALIPLGFVKVTPYTPLVIPAIAILFLMSIPFASVASILFARYRDLPRLISGSIVLVIMLTPIFWKPEMISGWRSAIVYLNPVYYVIDFVRSPLLGEPIKPLTGIVVLGLAAALWIAGAYFYNRYQKYVVFWI
jgi:ABC-2 type transport system permease protein/lipopolysaccharide transport system permease protein